MRVRSLDAFLNNQHSLLYFNALRDDGCIVLFFVIALPGNLALENNL